MKILRKNVVLVAMLTLMVLTLSLCVSEAYAYSSNEYSNLLEEDRQNTKTFIENWIANTYKNDGTELSKITKTYGYNDAVSGYIIDFKKDNMPNGYILLDKQSKNHIKEFALSGESISNRLTENSDTSLKDLKIYQKFGNLFAKNKRESIDKLYDLYNNIISSRDIFNTTLYSNEIYKELVFFPDERVDSQNNVDLPNSVYVTPLTTYNYSDDGNCALVATANIIRWSRSVGKVKNENFNDYYDMKRITNFKIGLNDIQALEGLKKYAKEYNQKVKIDAYWFDTWDDFTRDIRAQKIIFLGLKPWLAKAAHAMVVVGFNEMPSGGKYLRVYDGWHRVATRYIEFKKSNYSKFDGASVDFYE